MLEKSTSSIVPQRAGIGQPVPRKEDRRLVTGCGQYSDDLNLPDQVFAVMVRSPHAHARVRSIDVREAVALPGVLAVFTGRDLREDGLRPIPHATWSKHPAELMLQNKDGSAVVFPPHYPMAELEVLHVGEIVAMVIADTVAAAKDGAERVAVDYEPLPAMSMATVAAEPNAPRVREDRASNVCLDAEVGDRQVTEDAFARAAHVAKLKTWVPRVAGVPMEPRAAIGAYDPSSGRYTLYAGIGAAVRPKQDLAKVLNVAEGAVRVVMHDVGGNFGTRGAFNPEFALVTWGARQIGRPVKWTCERQEAFVCDYQARDLAVEAELALDEDGNFLAMRGSNVVNNGAHTVAFGPLQKGLEIMSSIYHVPTVHFRARAVLTNTVPTRAYRSSGRPEVMFVMERLIDLAAKIGGFDRLELRRRNLVPETAMPYRNPFGMVYDSGAYHKVMERTLEIGDWAGFPARKRAALKRGRLRGIGVANYVDTATGAPRERAEITVRPEGVVDVVLGTVSQGQGHETTFAQLVNEWLGVALDQVKLITGDTDKAPVGGGAHSGRALRMGSAVMYSATKEILKKGAQIASCLLEVEEADIEFVDSAFKVKGTDRIISLFDVAAAALDDDRVPEDLRGLLRAESDQEFLIPAFPYGCHVCEVEVDAETGEIRIVRYSAVDDVGRAVNPLIVEGQTHGGIAQGIGEALIEQCFYDPSNAQLLTGSFMDYAMPRADFLPSFDTELSEVPSPTHPLGIRPGGEGGITPALASIVNAAVDALSDLGVTHLELPLTSERIWRAIHEARGLSHPT
jgi:carbon-monoxide dehydrogenase large subunit